MALATFTLAQISYSKEAGMTNTLLTEKDKTLITTISKQTEKSVITRQLTTKKNSI